MGLSYPANVASVREGRSSLPGHMMAYDAIATMKDGSQRGLIWNEKARCYFDQGGLVVRVT